MGGIEFSAGKLKSDGTIQDDTGGGTLTGAARYRQTNQRVLVGNLHGFVKGTSTDDYAGSPSGVKMYQPSLTGDDEVGTVLSWVPVNRSGRNDVDIAISSRARQPTTDTRTPTPTLEPSPPYLWRIMQWGSCDPIQDSRIVLYAIGETPPKPVATEPVTRDRAWAVMEKHEHIFDDYPYQWQFRIRVLGYPWDNRIRYNTGIVLTIARLTNNKTIPIPVPRCLDGVPLQLELDEHYAEFVAEVVD